jgi:hypothetical protein
MLDYIDIHGLEYRFSDQYSKQEVLKIEDYNKNMGIIVDELFKIIGDKKTLINIEGYSYGSMGKTVSLVDLIALGTLLRNKLHTKLNCDIRIVSPSELKRNSCMLTYGYTEKGKKNITITTRNDIGVAGGNFTKREMMKALSDYKCDTDLSKFIKQNFTELYSMSNIPAPIPDLIDSYWLLKTLMNDEIYHIKNILS